jgi:hypothetical protein
MDYELIVQYSGLQPGHDYAIVTRRNDAEFFSDIDGWGKPIPNAGGPMGIVHSLQNKISYFRTNAATWKDIQKEALRTIGAQAIALEQCGSDVTVDLYELVAPALGANPGSDLKRLNLPTAPPINGGGTGSATATSFQPLFSYHYGYTYLNKNHARDTTGREGLFIYTSSPGLGPWYEGWKGAGMVFAQPTMPVRGTTNSKYDAWMKGF